MGSVIRPVFQNGERLTAQRLNEIVEYLRSSLRRTLLAPLSPGVAAGLQLQGTPTPGAPVANQIASLAGVSGTPQTRGIASIAVSPGVAIDGAARILVSTQGLSFTYQDIAAQITDLAVGDHILVSLGADLDAASSVPDDCAPTTGARVSEGVKLVFTRPLSATTDLVVAASTPAPSINAWADPIAGSATTYAVPLGSVSYQADGTLIPSLTERAGVMPSVGALRSSFGDVSLLLDRFPNGTPALAVTVLTVFTPTAPAFFQTFAGGPLVQSAYVATNLGMPPAGRANASTPTVFEAAGGNTGIPVQGGLPGLPGTTGVVAISMQYDVAAGTAAGFPTVPQAGFPLVLSTSSAAATQPLVAPPPAQNAQSGNYNYIGLSAAPSQPDPTDPTGARVLVPVATAGIILAYIFLSEGTTTPLPPGTLLTPLPSATTGSPTLWGLTTSANSSGNGVTVAQLATPIANVGAAGALVPALVWVVPPNNFAPFFGVITEGAKAKV